MWSVVRTVRSLMRPPLAIRLSTPVPDKLKILDLEAEHWRARKTGDVARADPIEAALRDIPESGWPSAKASGSSGDR